MTDRRCDPVQPEVTPAEAGRAGFEASEGRPFTGRVAIVTGGGSGIGQAVALAYARRGGAVVVLGLSQDKLDATVALAAQEGLPPVRTAAVDVRDPQAVALAVDEVAQRHGRLDALVNSAAGNFVVPAEELSPNGWRAVVDIVLNGTFYVTRAAAPYMLAAGRGVRVNCVAPGPTETAGASAALWATQADRARVLDSVPARRFATPDEVAEATLFLLEDRSATSPGTR